MKLDAVPITPRAKKIANPVRAKAYGMRELEVTLRCRRTMRLSDAGLRRRKTKLICPDHRPLLGSPKTRPRDRSNRLLDVSRTKVNLNAIRNDSVQLYRAAGSLAGAEYSDGSSAMCELRIMT
jgi:hypothetical protein